MVNFRWQCWSVFDGNLCFGDVEKSKIYTFVTGRELISFRWQSCSNFVGNLHIYANILADQRGEALKLIVKCSNGVKEFLGYPKYKDGILECIDKLIEYRKMFEEKWPEYGADTLD